MKGLAIKAPSLWRANSFPRSLSPQRRSPSVDFLFGSLRRLLLLCGICILLVASRSVFSVASAKLPTYQRPEHFPHKIWQSWKVEATKFEDRDAERSRTWTTKNANYRYEVMTDWNADEYVALHFGPLGFNRPDIVHVYQSLRAKIIKQDLLRYLIMYVEGGVYADIDVEAIRPVKQWIPKRFPESKIDMVIGIETDEPDFAAHPVLGSKSQSFCQWTFMCKPQLPVMMRLIENIMKWLHTLSVKQGKPIEELYLDFNEVISGTGPSAFTIAILAEMSKVTGKRVAWDAFHDLTDAVLVGGVLVLNVEAFAAGTGHSNSGNHKGKGAMVKHHFHASSWPSKHPRLKHPVYGEVEACNWNMECVKLWDANTAMFDALPEGERLKIIALKQKDDARKSMPPPMMLPPGPPGKEVESEEEKDGLPSPLILPAGAGPGPGSGTARKEAEEDEDEEDLASSSSSSGASSGSKKDKTDDTKNDGKTGKSSDADSNNGNGKEKDKEGIAKDGLRSETTGRSELEPVGASKGKEEGNAEASKGKTP